MTVNWAPIKTALASLFGAAIPIITHLYQTSSFPTTWSGWFGVIATAATAAGLYQAPSPSQTTNSSSVKS